jgi:hypothetical protein
MRPAVATPRVGRTVIWVILAAVGVPLWFCAAAIGVLIYRNRALRKRGGNVPVRLRTGEGQRWVRGHGIWVHDVFGFRGSPAAWSERLLWVTDTSVRPATEDERKGAKGIHGLGDDPIVVTFEAAGAGPVEVAARAEHRNLLEVPDPDLVGAHDG